MAWYGEKSPSKVSQKGQDSASLSKPFIVLMGTGDTKIYSSVEDIELLNFQRGLASLLILRQENVEIDETDVLGKCKTKYRFDHHGLHKVKEKCQSGHEDQSELFDNRKYSNIKYLYKLQEGTGIIDSLEVREWLEFYPNLTPEIAQDLQQRQGLTMKGRIQFTTLFYF